MKTFVRLQCFLFFRFFWGGVVIKVRILLSIIASVALSTGQERVFNLNLR